MTIERPMFPPQRDEHPLIDTVGCPEFFAEGVARIERVGGCRRLVLYSTQPGYQGAIERVAVVRLVLSAETAAGLAEALWSDAPNPTAFASLSLAVAN
ncbi:hypothetical protein [Rhodopseudomonas sp. RCAM05734]|uniref:hypothetical protein n=1 Tax=Rhodopseudomonas sp. RCAM05734 TaxID=3457549 RepID=UPI0040443D2E